VFVVGVLMHLRMFCNIMCVVCESGADARGTKSVFVLWAKAEAGQACIGFFAPSAPHTTQFQQHKQQQCENGRLTS